MSKLLTVAAAAMMAFSPLAAARADDERHDEPAVHEGMHDMDEGGSMSGTDMGGMMDGGMMGGGMMGGCAMMQGMQHSMKSGMKSEKGAMMGGGMMTGEMMEQRLTKLKVELKITDAETQAWDGYAAAVKARGEAMKSNREAMMKAMGEGTAVAKIETHIAAMEKMVGNLKTLKAATETLYASLDDAQKKTADKVLGAGCMM